MTSESQVTFKAGKTYNRYFLFMTSLVALIPVTTSMSIALDGWTWWMVGLQLLLIAGLGALLALAVKEQRKLADVRVDRMELRMDGALIRPSDVKQVRLNGKSAEIHLNIGNPVERVYRYKGDESELERVRSALEAFGREQGITVVK
ncbi:hypothetical protein ACFFSY_21285 [Paenibacillus aurantiacus]|uniref:Uncharacterized protein n=1 Tax=Paenibacillus aurantiacus TaxID=1936118 RepID=A0ABV5KTF9_9BACL